MLSQASRKMNQELVSFVKSICAIVKLHPYNIKENKRRSSTFFEDVFNKIFATNTAIFYIRKARQRIEITVGLIADAQKDRIFSMPLDNRGTQNQIRTRSRIHDDDFTFFKNFVNGNMAGITRLKEVFFKRDSRFERTDWLPYLSDRSAFHINFMSLCINDDKRFYFVCFQKLKNIVT